MSLPLWEECAWVKNGISTTSGDHIAQPQGEFDPLDPFSQSAAEPKSHVFPLDVSLSSKIYLHLGQGYKVPADCLVIGQNEQLSDRTEDNLAVFILGGPSFEEELQALAPIQTGDSTITSGGTLPFNWVVHAVGPRYDERFLSASDQALYSAYRNALVLAADKNVQDIVITCIYSKRKKYPRFEAAHVALRTVRKFLQHPVGTGFRRIMFSVPEQDDFEIYSALLSAYFPRNQQEVESQINLLPKELGDAWGQIILDDRRVSISAGPKPLPKESMEEYRKQNNPVIDEEDALKPIKTGTREILDVGERPTSMADMGGDKDEERRKRVAKDLAKMSREDRLKLKFQLMVDEIENDPLDDIAEMGFFSFAGKDKQRRDIVVITAANLNLKGKDPERVLLYIMKMMEYFRCKPFVLLYANSGVTEDNQPDQAFVQEVFDLFAARYKENLQQLYIVHASFMFRMYIWIALPFLTTPFWSTYICASSLKELSQYMEVDELKFPQAMIDYEKTL